MMSTDKSRASFMSAQHVAAMNTLPRTHQNCIAKTGVARPGKTAKDAAARKRDHGTG